MGGGMNHHVGRAGKAWQLAIVAAVVLTAASVRAIDSDSLRLLLLGAQDMSTPQTMLRADIAIALDTYKGPRSTQAIAFFMPGKDARWYIQLKDPDIAALVRGAERKVMQRNGGTIQTSSISEPIADLGVSYEDLSRFIVDDFKLWQIADENNDTVLAGGHPQVESAYVYRAYTFDKARTIPVKVQFYAKTLNNLVKLRTDSDHQLVGKKWFPGTIEIQNFPESSKAKFSIKWSQAATAPPELFAPESFPGTSPVPWTSPAPAPPSSPKPAS
jgi:hypothetical protein